LKQSLNPRGGRSTKKNLSRYRVSRLRFEPETSRKYISNDKHKSMTFAMATEIQELRNSVLSVSRTSCKFSLPEINRISSHDAVIQPPTRFLILQSGCLQRQAYCRHFPL
jgi:hypothetical protein